MGAKTVETIVTEGDSKNISIGDVVIVAKDGNIDNGYWKLFYVGDYGNETGSYHCFRLLIRNHLPGRNLIKGIDFLADESVKAVETTAEDTFGNVGELAITEYGPTHRSLMYSGYDPIEAQKLYDTNREKVREHYEPNTRMSPQAMQEFLQELFQSM